MPRGYLFHINTSPDGLYSLTSNSFDNNAFMQSLCDCYSTKNAVQTDANIDNCDQMLVLFQKLSMTVRKIKTPRDSICDSPFLYQIQMSAQQKDDYFEYSYNRLREYISNLTLRDFENIHMADTIEQLVTDNSRDVVLFGDHDEFNGTGLDETPYTMDGFMRAIQPEKIYYLHPVNLVMH